MMLKKGAVFHKSPNSGGASYSVYLCRRRLMTGMKGLVRFFIRNPPRSLSCVHQAFVKDPDGYLIEILPQGPMITKPVDCCGVTVEGGEGYKDNSK